MVSKTLDMLIDLEHFQPLHNAAISMITSIRRINTVNKNPEKSSSPKTRDPLFISSLEKALLVLNAFKGAEQYMGQSEIISRTGLHKSAVQRFLHTWEALGYIKRDEASKRYLLTGKVMDLSYEYLRMNPLIEIATPHLLEARNRTNYSFNLSVIDGADTIYLVRMPNHLRAYKATLPGRRLPAALTSGGRAMMSRMSDERIEDILTKSDLVPHTPFTITDKAKIKAEIEKGRNQGYCITVQEFLIGEIAVAAPVVNSLGQPVAAVHIPASISDWPYKRVAEELAPIVMDTARSITPP